MLSLLRLVFGWLFSGVECDNYSILRCRGLIKNLWDFSYKSRLDCIQGHNNCGCLKMGVGSIIKLRIVYQVFKKLGNTLRWGRGDCKTPKIKIVNDMIKKKECLWCNLEIVGAVMLMLASKVIKLLENILVIYIIFKAIIPFVFSGDVYSLIGLMMRINFGCILEYHHKVDLYDEYMCNDSVLQCGGDALERRDVCASASLKINSDSGRRFKVKIRTRMVVTFQRLLVSADLLNETCNN